MPTSPTPFQSFDPADLRSMVCSICCLRWQDLYTTTISLPLIGSPGITMWRCNFCGFMEQHGMGGDNFDTVCNTLAGAMQAAGWDTSPYAPLPGLPPPYFQKAVYLVDAAFEVQIQRPQLAAVNLYKWGAVSGNGSVEYVRALAMLTWPHYLWPYP